MTQGRKSPTSQTGWKRPDWTSMNAYPDPNKTSLKQWAWEFLRRNPHYRVDYVKANALITEDCGFEETAQFDSYCRNYGINFMYNPEIPDSELEELMLTLEFVPSPVPHHIFYQPGANYVANLFPSELSPSAVNIPLLKPTVPGEIIMKFDASLPINAQLMAAKQLMEQHQSALTDDSLITPITNRHHKDLFQLYLRLLDAEYAHVSIAEMIKTIDPAEPSKFRYNSDRQRLQQSQKMKLEANLDTARRYQEHGYRYITLTGSTVKK